MNRTWDEFSKGSRIQLDGTVEIVRLPIKDGGSFHSYVNVDQRVIDSGLCSKGLLSHVYVCMSLVIDVWCILFGMNIVLYRSTLYGNF